MNPPLFSVVTISYNQANYLRACIESVLSQSSEDLEYFVVDGGSQDGSIEILKSISDPRFRWISEPDKGPGDALNKGFSRVKGGILCYINADDMLLPGALARAAAEFSKLPEVDVIFGDGIEIDSSGKAVRRLFSSRWSKTGYAHGVCSVLQQSTFFTASAFQRSGGFNVSNRVIWDAELIADMAVAGCKLRYIPKPFGAFRIHSESQTGSRRAKTAAQIESFRIRSKLANITPTKSTAIAHALLYFLRLIGTPHATIHKALTYPFSRPRY